MICTNCFEVFRGVKGIENECPFCRTMTAGVPPPDPAPLIRIVRKWKPGARYGLTLWAPIASDLGTHTRSSKLKIAHGWRTRAWTFKLGRKS